MSWTVALPQEGDPIKGDGQCAKLPQLIDPRVSNTHSFWIPGEQVKGKRLAQGTVIAVFNSNGDYQNMSGVAHVALYVRQDKLGIEVLEQYSGLTNIKKTKYFFGGGPRITKNGDNYYVVEHRGRHQSGSGLIHSKSSAVWRP